MGTVWKARDTTLDRDVAIKVLPPEFSANPERLARFEREAKAVAALSHANIVAIHGFGTHEGNAYAPGNVFLSPDGRARILDFGLAAVAGVGSHEGTELATRTSLTNPGAVMGTTNYMSPEQVQGASADSRCRHLRAGHDAARDAHRSETVRALDGGPRTRR